MEWVLAAIAVIYIATRALAFIIKKIRRKNADKELVRIYTYLEKTLDP